MLNKVRREKSGLQLRWELHRHRSPPAGGALDADGAAVGFGDPFRDRETKAGAAH